MKKLLISLFILATIQPNAFGLGKVGDYIGTGGIGFTASPSTFLLAPQLEYVYREDLTIAGAAQIGLSEGVLFTGGGIARWSLGSHAYIKPSFEAGIGIALASGILSKSFGVHILTGIGVDYVLSKDMTIGTMLRLNFAPPLQGFFISWPLITARFLL